MAGTGSVALVTILRQGPSQPGVAYTDGHPLVAIELDEQPGLRFAGTIIDTAPEAIGVGDRVEMVWRDVPGRRGQLLLLQKLAAQRRERVGHRRTA